MMRQILIILNYDVFTFTITLVQRDISSQMVGRLAIFGDWRYLALSGNVCARVIEICQKHKSKTTTNASSTSHNP